MQRSIAALRLVSQISKARVPLVRASLPLRSFSAETKMASVNITPDGGIIKQILKEGSGETPSPGSHVTAHYTGRFPDGSVFDSSVKRGKPFAFTIGIGQVIKGWDLGIASMKRGEKCILTCQPDYAYGKRGAGGVIPPNATLQFEVELIDFI